MSVSIDDLDEAAWRNGWPVATQSGCPVTPSSVDQVGQQRLLRAVRQVVPDRGTEDALLVRFGYAPRYSDLTAEPTDPVLLETLERQIQEILTAPASTAQPGVVVPLLSRGSGA